MASVKEKIEANRMAGKAPLEGISQEEQDREHEKFLESIAFKSTQEALRNGQCSIGKW